MKKTILLSLTIISSFFSIAQDIDTFKKNDSITMFGVDYSQTYFVGKEGFTNPYAIESQFFNKWNNLFLMEQEKYSISKALKKSAVYYSIEYITSVNDNVTTEEIKSRIVNSVYQKDLLSLEEAKKIAISYDLQTENRFGILFFATEYNKISDVGTYHAIIIDIKSKEIVQAITLSGATGGFGFRNFWATTFHNSLKDLKRKL